jgi:hypothetical protein
MRDFREDLHRAKCIVVEAYSAIAAHKRRTGREFSPMEISDLIDRNPAGLIETEKRIRKAFLTLEYFRKELIRRDDKSARLVLRAMDKTAKKMKEELNMTLRRR